MEESRSIKYACGEIVTAPLADKLKRIAYRQDEMPQGLASSAQTFFLKARLLYRQKLEPEQGKREMSKIERAYEEDWEMENLNYRVSQLWNRIDVAAYTYTHEKTIENADKFLEAVYGVPIDTVLLERGVKNDNQ